MIDWKALDMAEIELLQREDYKGLEAMLRHAYDESKANADTDGLVEAITRLASFYALPMIEEYDRAASLYGEAEFYDKTPQSCLNTAMFRWICLQNPILTLEKLEELNTDDVRRQDPGVFFQALCIRGECFIQMDRSQEIAALLANVSNLARQRINGVVLGDSFNLLRELIRRNQLLDDCQSLLDFYLTAPLSRESRQTASELRGMINSQ